MKFRLFNARKSLDLTPVLEMMFKRKTHLTYLEIRPEKLNQCDLQFALLFVNLNLFVRSLFDFF